MPEDRACLGQPSSTFSRLFLPFPSPITSIHGFSFLSALPEMFKPGAAGGLQSILKEGGKHYAGVDEAVMKNIEAAKNLSVLTRSSFGPHGMNKLIVNHLERHFVTRDAAVILQEMEVMHPAAKLVVMAAKSQEQECGDATNFVTVFSGELLNQAEELLKQGVHASDIIRGFEIAGKAAVEQGIPSLPVHVVSDLKSIDQLTPVLTSVVSSKQLGLESVLGKLVAEACVAAMPEDPTRFETDSIRVAKLLGGGDLYGSYVVHGLVVPRDCLGVQKRKTSAKVAVFSIPLEMTNTETGGNVLITNAKDLVNYTKGEEAKMEEFVRSLSDAGVQVVISGGAVQDIALHFLNKFGILVLRCTSKFEIKRLAQTLGATQMVRLGAPLQEELGYAESVAVEEISSQKVTVFKSSDSKIASIVLRGATSNTLDEVERAIDDAVQTVRCMAVKGERNFCYGGGAAEAELAETVRKAAAACPGLEQYAAFKFAEALEVIPKVLADNAGLRGTEAVASLTAAHTQGRKTACIDVDARSSTNVLADAKERGIFDHLGSKTWAIRLALDAALTVLRTQHIIVAKQAGGPAKPKGEANVDDD